MKIKRLTLVLVAILIATSAAIAQNPEREKRDNEHRKAMMKRHEQVAERMNNFFTGEQQEQIKTLRIQSAKKIKPLRNQLHELEARQQTLATSDKADLKAIYKNIDEVSEIKAEIQKIMAKQQQDIRAMLDEEQLLKYDAMKERMHEKRHDFPGSRKSRVDRKG